MTEQEQPPAGPTAPGRFERELTVSSEGVTAIDVLARAVPLSRQKLKLCMARGAVWLKKQKGGRRRLRRAKTTLRPGDVLELFYDEHVLASEAPDPRLIADRGSYSVWYKPAQMLSQGSRYGDHCAITRWVEKQVQPQRAVYLVHRLDRAASGLMLLAHDRKTAARLSKLFANRDIRKLYRVVVGADFDLDLPHEINTPLDGKAAHTRILSAQPEAEGCQLLVEIGTGRKHQIRRHLAELGWPVLGDRLYGDPKTRAALALCATVLEFDCPVSGERTRYQLDSVPGQPPE